MTMTRTWLLLGAGATLLSAEASAQRRMQGSGIPIVKESPAVSSTPAAGSMTVTSNGEVTLLPAFDISAYANMNEKNITAFMAGGDSLEIQLGQLARTKGTDARVRNYGSMLATDHTAHLAKTIEIVTDEDVGAEPLMSDPEGLRMRALLAQLQSKSAGASWDAAFLRFQAEHHQHAIDILTPNLKNAHDDDLEDHIEKTFTSLAKHRDMAKSIATEIGVSIP